MKRLLLFDLDGTLVDVAGAGREALRRAMERVYGEAGPISTFAFHGKTDPAIVHGLLREAGYPPDRVEPRLPELWSAYLRALSEELRRRREDGRVRPYPGVPELLDRLERDSRFSLALVTGNVAPGAWEKLEAGGLDGRFSYGAFGSDSKDRDELPPIALRRARRRLGTSFGPEDAVVVGDTAADIRCARANGMRAVAVATGRPELEELRAHAPDRLFADFSDTEAVLEALAGTAAVGP